MKITIRMFGAFRALGTELVLVLPSNANVQALREALRPHLEGMDLDELLGVSKFANEREVLADHAPCTDGQILAILPPVSGG